MLAPPTGGILFPRGLSVRLSGFAVSTLAPQRKRIRPLHCAAHSGNIDAPSIPSASSTCSFGIRLSDGCVDIFTTRKNTVITDATYALQLNQAAVVRPAESADKPVPFQLLRIFRVSTFSG